jgi:hypothetical protein
MPSCALHHSVVTSLNLVVCSIATSPGFGSLRILSTKGRHGLACQEKSTLPRQSAARRDTRAPIAASQPFFSRRGDRLHPFQIYLHRRRPTLLVARWGWDRGACTATLPRHRCAADNAEKFPRLHSTTASARKIVGAIGILAGGQPDKCPAQ